MRAILINAKDRTVTEVEADSLQDWYKHIDCELVTHAGYIQHNDAIMVDDEGLIHGDPEHWFVYEGLYQPFAGNGLVIGEPDDDGDTTPAKSTIDEVESRVRFMTTEKVMTTYK